jgi:hypothetical protein
MHFLTVIEQICEQVLFRIGYLITSRLKVHTIKKETQKKEIQLFKKGVKYASHCGDCTSKRDRNEFRI